MRKLLEKEGWCNNCDMLFSTSHFVPTFEDSAESFYFSLYQNPHFFLLKNDVVAIDVSHCLNSAGSLRKDMFLKWVWGSWNQRKFWASKTGSVTLKAKSKQKNNKKIQTLLISGLTAVHTLTQSLENQYQTC